MKQLYLVRHAKSSRDDPSLLDKDRPLSKRGKHDIQLIGQRLHDKGVVLDMLVTSSSKRTKKTARGIGTCLGYAKKDIISDEKLYMASSATLFDLITKVSTDVDNLMIVAHNNGISELAISLGADIGRMPTCAVVCFFVDVTDWKDLDPGLVNVERYDYPKKLETRF